MVLSKWRFQSACPSGESIHDSMIICEKMFASTMDSKVGLDWGFCAQQSVMSRLSKGGQSSGIVGRLPSTPTFLIKSFEKKTLEKTLFVMSNNIAYRVYFVVVCAKEYVQSISPIISFQTRIRLDRKSLIIIQIYFSVYYLPTLLSVSVFCSPVSTSGA